MVSQLPKYVVVTNGVVVTTINFEHISHLVPVFLYVTLSR